MIQLLGIPYDKNSSFLTGSALAPPRIRLMATDGSANLYSEGGLKITENKLYNDLGDLQFEDKAPAAVFNQIRNKVSTILEKPARLISLGGDHSVSYPVIDAHTDLYENLHVLHFDAHGDLYENYDNNPYSHASPFARLMETLCPVNGSRKSSIPYAGWSPRPYRAPVGAGREIWNKYCGDEKLQY